MSSKVESIDERRQQRQEYMKEYNKHYRQTHRTEIIAYRRRNYAIKRERVLAQNQVCLSKQHPYESIYDTTDKSIIELMDNKTNEFYNAFESYLKEKTELTEDEIKHVYKLAKSAHNSITARHGFDFERAIRTYLLNQFANKGLYLYYQVPFDGCRIDFVVTKEVNDREKLDISQAIIISAKTTLSTTWRQDQHLFDKCKSYIMLTLDGTIPTETFPDNVYFCFLRNTETKGFILSADDLITTIISILLD